MKRALLIGCSYKDTTSELRGTVNDIIRMKECLINKFDFEEKQIKLLIEIDGYEKPTKANIIKQIVDLIIKSIFYGYNTIYIHFSGHGTHIFDTSRDEKDQYDECWVPTDYKESGIINDDYLNYYFNYFSENCYVTCVIDACRSGTGLDLKYKIDTSNNSYDIVNEQCNCTTKNIIKISACKANQYALGIYKNGEWGGALTNSILHALDNDDNRMPLYKLIEETRKYMKDGFFEQIPQLCSSKIISSNKMFICN